MPQRHNETNRHLRWWLFALLLLVPGTAYADTISLTDYHNNLQRAITELDTLEHGDEDENTSSYAAHFDQTITEVSEIVPQHQSVQTRDGVCNVDNTWLHEALKQLKNASPDERSDKFEEIIPRLRALDERVEPKPSSPATDKAQTKNRLQGILARPEYASEARGPNAADRLLMRFIRWLQQFLPKGFEMHPTDSRWLVRVAEVLVVLVAAVVLFYVLRILLGRLKPARRRRPTKKREPRIVLGEQLAPEDTSVDLLAEAEALARRGDVRGAIRKAYIALLVELGDRKLLTLAQHKTNRDYLNAIRTVPPLHQTMRGLTESFERHWYGVVDATDSDWQTFRSGYQSALQTQN